MKTEHKNRDIQDGFLILILIVFVLFLLSANGLDVDRGMAGHGGDGIMQDEEISSFNKITLGLPVSINKETEEGLTAVPGIGPVTANAIVEERTSRGGFKTLEELRSVKGIGDKTFNKIRIYVSL